MQYRPTEKTGPSVLVVEDDEGLNFLLQKILAREGLEVEGVATGLEALAIVEKNDCRIMLLDYILKDMTADKLIRLLNEKGLEVPFIVMTGQGNEKTAVEMMKLGARDYIIKDVGLMEMIPHIVKRTIEEIKRERDLAYTEKKLRERQTDISILYSVSTALNQTIDLEELFEIILDAITNLEIYEVGRQAGIFLVEGDRMHLVCSRGHPEGFMDLHKSIRVGTCLCGLAAKTGEIIVSKNCMDDKRHSLTFPGMEAHGHIIIPLHARGVIGVLFLYLEADAEIDEEKLKLMSTLGNQIGIAIDNAKLYEEAKKFALEDPLTGLANRRMMHIVFDRTLDSAKRFNKTFSVIMMDIDFFKDFNDRKGHYFGDKKLVEIARLAEKETRQIDLVVRYGGEEFLVLLPDTDKEKALEVAERIRTTVEAETGVTVSLGIASYSDKMKKEEIIRNADRALYRAKEGGRNRTEVYK